MNLADITCSILAGLLAASPATARPSNISTASKYAWSENFGWIDFRDAGSPAASQGVRIDGGHAMGFAWSENIGWINFGDGAPANGVAYANSTGDDFGVNVDAATGALSGLAWGENAGWINFTLPSLPAAQQPRLDKPASRLRGYAWGENFGWINLDDADAFVAIDSCPADFNQNAQVTVQDVFDFLVAYFATDPAADFNGNGAVTVQDVFDYLVAYFAGCP